MRPLGILGGAFDPIHHGHLRLATEVGESLGLGFVHLIATNNPPHRQRAVADAEMRHAMVQAAVQGDPLLRGDDRELRRQGPSYTVDTLVDLRREFTDRPICLILGLDSFQTLPTWHRWEQLLDLAHIVVAHRPAVEQPSDGQVSVLLASHLVDSPARLRQRTAGHILFQPIPLLDISATRIRAAIARGRSVRYLVPDSVLALITRHRLYHAS